MTDPQENEKLKAKIEELENIATGSIIERTSLMKRLNEQENNLTTQYLQEKNILKEEIKKLQEFNRTFQSQKDNQEEVLKEQIAELENKQVSDDVNENDQKVEQENSSLKKTNAQLESEVKRKESLITKLQDELNRSTKISAKSSTLPSFDSPDTKFRLEEKTASLKQSEERLALQIKNSMLTENRLKETIAELQSKYEETKSQLDSIKPPEGLDDVTLVAHLFMKDQIEQWVANLNQKDKEINQLREENTIYQKKMYSISELENRVKDFEKERAIREKTESILREKSGDIKSLGELTHLPITEILENYIGFSARLNHAPTSMIDEIQDPFILPSNIPFSEKVVARMEDIESGELKETSDALQLHLRKMKVENAEIFGENFIDDTKIEEMLDKFRSYDANEFGEEQAILKTALADVGWAHLIKNLSQETSRLQNRITHYKHELDKEQEIKSMSEEISNSENRWEFETQRNKTMMDVLHKFIEKKKLMDEELNHWENFGGFVTTPKEVKEIETLQEKRRKSIDLAKKNIFTSQKKEHLMEQWITKEELDYNNRETQDRLDEKNHEEDVRKQTKIFSECLVLLGSLIHNLATFRKERAVRRRDMREKRKFAEDALESWKQYRNAEEKILDIRLRQAKVITIGQQIYDACFQGAQNKSKHNRDHVITKDREQDDILFIVMQRKIESDISRQKNIYLDFWRKHYNEYQEKETKFKRAKSNRLQAMEFKRYDDELGAIAFNIQLNQRHHEEVEKEYALVQDLYKEYNPDTHMEFQEDRLKECEEHVSSYFFTRDAPAQNLCKFAAPPVNLNEKNIEEAAGLLNFRSPSPSRKRFRDNESGSSSVRTKNTKMSQNSRWFGAAATIASFRDKLSCGKRRKIDNQPSEVNDDPGPSSQRFNPPTPPP